MTLLDSRVESTFNVFTVVASILSKHSALISSLLDWLDMSGHRHQLQVAALAELLCCHTWFTQLSNALLWLIFGPRGGSEVMGFIGRRQHICHQEREERECYGASLLQSNQRQALAARQTQC